jgi:DNA-binding response OmpR family regulator
VEDDSALRASLKFAFEIEGFSIQLFESGAAALEASLVLPCCRLIVDYALPDMDGVHLVAQLQAAGVKGRPVFMTTAPNERLRREAKSLNAPIVEKPLTQDRLLRIVNQLGCACGAAA